MVDLLNQLEEISEYSFLYRSDLFNKKEKLSFNEKSIDIKQILKKYLTNRGYEYEIDDKTIIILRKKEVKPVHVPSQIDQVKIYGEVIDSFGEALPGVTISILGTNRGVVTDVDGKFSVTDICLSDHLIFSYIGYNSYEYIVTQKMANLKVVLKQSVSQLEETVIVGLGKKKRVSVVGAISSVQMAELDVPATNMTNMIGGTVPGIITIVNSGEPGKNNSEFWIRGIGTFGANSTALVLIDGLEGSLNEVDPADVESFSILKDASATAVYGMKGANGVVLITTKRGKKGKINLTARTNLTASFLRRKSDYLNASQYAKMANEASVVSGNEPVYSPIEMDLIKYNMDPDLYPNVNWQNEILKDFSWQKTAYLSARGGTSVARYFLSVGMSSDEAIYNQESDSRYKQKNGYTTYNYRSNLDMNITQTTKVYLGTDGFISRYQTPGLTSTDYLWQSLARLTPLTVPLRYSNGAFPAYGKDSMISPYVLLNYTGYANWDFYRTTSTLAITQNLDALIRGLSAKVQGALYTYNYFSEYRRKMPDCYYATGRSINGDLKLVKMVNKEHLKYGKHESQYRRTELQARVNYSRVIDDVHRFSGLIYYYMTSRKRSNAKTSMDAIPKRYQGLSSRFTYSYNDAYHLDLNFGYTGSENFKPGKQFGFFPSIGLGWTPTSYQTIKDQLTWLDYFKLRLSWGQVGNDRISDKRFPYLTIVGGKDGAWGHEGGLGEEVVGADNLKWEKSTKIDLGVEANMFDNRLSFVVDFFKDIRDGIFQQRKQIPDYVGAVNMPYGNVGSMESYGADGNVSYTHKFSKELTATVRGNFTYSTNKVKTWEQPATKYEYQHLNGKPLNALRGYRAAGLFLDENDIESSPAQFGKLRPGDIKYMDVNGDGVINADDKIPLSYSPFPRLMYGFGAELRYKKLSVNMRFQGIGTSNFFYGGYGYTPFEGGPVGNVLSIAAKQSNRWTPASYSGDKSTERQNVLYPRLTYGHNANNSKRSSFWLGDSRYIRLKEIGVTYRIKPKKLKKLSGIRSIDVSLTGYDLFVWDKVDIFDPELARYNGNRYPIPSRVGMQVYLRF
ncbi:SusC/RagA family TonB-linked outer membrane protein [Puteibacter caeruleilacunae]|nr:SusC/RagA family TonB-linked outer membrane protein [Puteibacter caeruleilacunae]